MHGCIRPSVRVVFVSTLCVCVCVCSIMCFNNVYVPFSMMLMDVPSFLLQASTPLTTDSLARSLTD